MHTGIGRYILKYTGYHAMKTVGQSGRVFGRPFVTAGWIVVAVSCVVAGMEIALLVLILQI